jgi:1-deoxy-D-xylulose-5-phosphate synthase
MAEELIRMAEGDPRVTAVTAAMRHGTGLNAFAERFPDRFFDVGIAEEHAVVMAGGMAAAGLRPYVAIYSTFLQRAFDQVLIDIALQRLPVVFLLDRAGLNGADGATHQGVFDLSFLRPIPNLILAAPRDVRDLRRLLRLSLTVDEPMAIRYPRDTADMGPGMERAEPLGVGEWELLASGREAVILAVGDMVEVALGASIELNGLGIECGVVDARFVKPMDDAMLRTVASDYPLIATVENNALIGGFGAGIVEKLSQWGCGAKVMRFAVPDRFIEHASLKEQCAECGLTAGDIARALAAAIRP